MSQKIMHVDNLYNFSLVRYEPSSIILIDKHSRKPYQFHQLANLNSLHPEIEHPNLLRPILYKNGVLYEKGCESLASLLDGRRRDYNPIRYSIEELGNTFEAVLECLEFLHSKGVVFGNLGPDHVVFFEDGAIYLKDWLFKGDEQCEANQASKAGDMKQMGFILALAATLLPENELKKLSTVQILALLMEFYSMSFCAAVAILLEGVSRYFPLVVGLIGSQNEPKLSDIKPLLDEALEIKNAKQKSKISESKKKQTLKEVQNQKSKIETPRKEQQKIQNSQLLTGSLQGSPTKKFNITTPNKKILRLEDCENKKVFNQEVKKRQIEKITKIIQRSNAFVNELMARKNNDRKYLNAAKVNSSMVETQENTKKVTYLKESPKVGSPAKRLRSISKKK